MSFQKATKEKSKLRLALFGPSGSGKTFTALRVATGMGGKIAVIDTEFGSASKYADRFNFDTVTLRIPNVDNYMTLIREAGNAGYGVLIIDSMSHGWQELLEQIDQIAKTKYKGNTWSAWNEGTPLQKDFVRTILACPCHIIATMRSKTEWSVQTGDNGKSRPVRVGLAPEQGKGIEYEFDMLMELSTDHTAEVIKDRTGKYQDKIIQKPGEEFGKELAAWLNDGASTAQAMNPAEQPAQAQPQSIVDQAVNQSTASAQQPAQQTPPAQPQNQAAAPVRQATPANQPKITLEQQSTIDAIADYFRVKAASETPGFIVSSERLKQVIITRYGKYPSTPTGASKVKAEIKLSDIIIPANQAA
jgi:hypothetical protein